MISIRHFDWRPFETLAQTSKGFSTHRRADVRESILDETTRVKQVSNTTYIVLGKSTHRDYFFSVVHYIKKFTLAPIFVRPMNDTERDHFERYQFLAGSEKVVRL